MDSNVVTPPLTSRSIGFPRSESTSPTSTFAPAAPRPAFSAASHPNETRPKGRWFVTVVMASLVGFVAVSMWNEFVRFQAYGELEGSLVRLSPEVPGTIRAIHVSEGDLVQAGQLLAEMDLRNLQREQRRLHRDMQIALSGLQVRLAEVQSRNRQLQAEQVDRQVKYFQLLGDYHANSARLKALFNTYQNNQALRAKDAASKSELMDSQAAYEGQKSQLEDLAAAIGTMEQPEVKAPDEVDLTILWETENTRIAALRAELDEIDDLISRSEIRAPVAGRVLKRFSEPGEQLRSSDTILELVESGSVEAVVYMPQNRAQVLAVGDQLRILIKPLGTRHPFRVTRISPEVVPPPETLKSNYRAFRGLVRVHAEQCCASGDRDRRLDTPADLTSIVGAELALPRFGFRLGPMTSPRSIAMRHQVLDPVAGD